MQEQCDKCDRRVDVYTDEWNLCRWCAPAPSQEVLKAIHVLKAAGMVSL